MKRSLILIFLFINSFIYSINEYDPILIGKILNGNKKENVGCNINVEMGVGHLSPTTYAIGPNGKIYFGDDLNERIAIFDINLNYVDEIKLKKPNINIGYMYTMKIADNNDVVLLNDYGLYRIDHIGNILYIMGNEQTTLEIDSKYNFFPIEGDILYYDDNKKIKLYGPTEKANNTKEVDENKIYELQEKAFSKNLGDKLIDKKRKFIKDESTFLKGNRLLTTDQYKYINYIKLLKNEKKAEKISDIDVERGISKFIGFDDDDNSYWEGRNNGRFIAVFSKQGEILDIFKYEIGLFTPQISPHGDLYYWNVTNECVLIYKITRQW